MKKNENMIEIQEDIQIGNTILEKGDKIKVLNEGDITYINLDQLIEINKHVRNSLWNVTIDDNTYFRETLDTPHRMDIYKEGFELYAADDKTINTRSIIDSIYVVYPRGSVNVVVDCGDFTLDLKAKYL